MHTRLVKKCFWDANTFPTDKKSCLETLCSLKLPTFCLFSHGWFPLLFMPLGYISLTKHPSSNHPKLTKFKHKIA